MSDLEEKIRAFLSAPWLDEDLLRFIREIAASAREEADQRHRANLATLGIELSKAREGWARACTERDAARGMLAEAVGLLGEARFFDRKSEISPGWSEATCAFLAREDVQRACATGGTE